ncbi:uncharacterized protein ASCRUDRAFT_119518 [Ascoidea rubescens DSM 1968]|uniref:Uncharacterized protein n=1 Tax=Ascoidea rubescens DSM 1968 TaxID=1344418 RepID=A0A1D2VA30_9ASCO|nr:hypothetical protein ASCRUDRAFT_119518 [Ascoidea rubescens DSM 1968]ODV58522.1 hypothetical protein ASCRUDRAFT_119518 [Ascoidea rubescens DSM 1968]
MLQIQQITTLAEGPAAAACRFCWPQHMPACCTLSPGPCACFSCCCCCYCCCFSVPALSLLLLLLPLLSSPSHHRRDSAAVPSRQTRRQKKQRVPAACLLRCSRFPHAFLFVTDHLVGVSLLVPALASALMKSTTADVIDCFIFIYHYH